MTHSTDREGPVQVMVIIFELGNDGNWRGNVNFVGRVGREPIEGSHLELYSAKDAGCHHRWPRDDAMCRLVQLLDSELDIAAVH